jgi:1,2-diacylglycerol 3-alpha-glucosyltransferase
MRIVLASETYPPDTNGAAYFTQRLAEALHRRGHQVLVLTTSRTILNQRSREPSGLIVLGIRALPVILYRYVRMSPKFIAVRSVRNAISSFGPNVIHIQNHFSIGRAALKAGQALGIPVIGTNHFTSETITVHAPLRGIGLQLLTAKLWRDFVQVYGCLDAVTAPTNSAAELTRARGIHRLVIPISNGIDTERFKPGNDGVYLRNRYDIPDSPVLLYIGRLDEEKRLDVILRALPLILRECSVHLVVAGIGAQRKTLEHLASSLGVATSVTFTGYISDDDLPNLHAIADAFVMPGNAELQSIATMEAMASGKPVIAAKALSLPELVHDGENGFLFADGDSRSLAACTIAMLKDEPLRRRMAERSLEIIQTHRLDAVLTKFESLYESVVQHATSEQTEAALPRPSKRQSSRRLALGALALLLLGMVLPMPGSWVRTWPPDQVADSIGEGLLDDSGVTAAFQRIRHIDVAGSSKTSALPPRSIWPRHSAEHRVP